MELAVIWGYFSFSDLGCFDLGCSDLGCIDLACSDLASSDLACSDLACSDLASSDLAHFFVKILTFFTQYFQLGNSFNTHPNGTNLTKWNFYTLFHNNIHIFTKRIAQYPFFVFSIRNDFLTLILAPPKYHVKIFKNQMQPLKPPYKKLYFINILLSPNICTFSDMEPFLHPYPIFSALLNLNFLT